MREMTQGSRLRGGAVQRRSRANEVAMKVAPEGCIKFHLDWTMDKAPDRIQELIFWRNRLYRAGLIGAYADGTGYGNISKRQGRGFIISGSATGNLATATAGHFTRVTGYDFERNSVSCAGPVKASSESLTHAAVYEASAAIQAVVHGHHEKIWTFMYGNARMTAPDIACGTSQMAEEILRLFETTPVESERFLVMAGHRDGIISFGPTLGVATVTMLDYL